MAIPSAFSNPPLKAMRRADRLFMIVEQLRPARLMTAADLGARLEVSVRTIYRDIADLIGAGVPIEGAAGAGYIMRAGYDLPPLMLTQTEAAALMAGARMLRAVAGEDWARAAAEAMDKITAVLPEAMAAQTAALPFFAPAARHNTALQRATFDKVEAAISARKGLHIRYTNLQNTVSTRHIEPAALFFWGDVWTLGAHCHSRGEVRMFRLDRIEVLAEGAPISPARARALAREIEQRHSQERARP